jgi:hypothetical protein
MARFEFFHQGNRMAIEDGEGVSAEAQWCWYRIAVLRQKDLVLLTTAPGKEEVFTVAKILNPRFFKRQGEVTAEMLARE